jgi:hypothetical protein
MTLSGPDYDARDAFVRLQKLKGELGKPEPSIVRCIEDVEEIEKLLCRLWPKSCS